MANTTNLNLSKLAGTEKLKNFPSPYNDNMDAIDGAFGSGFGVSGASNVNAEINALGDGLAIIANGNTHAAITSGQWVYVRQHSTLADGLYKATANVSANGTLSGSNLTADTSGGLNAVYSELNANLNNKFSMSTITTTTSSISDIASAIQTAFSNGDIPKNSTPFSINAGSSGWCLFGSASSTSANFIGIRADGVYAKFVLTGGVCTGTQLSW